MAVPREWLTAFPASPGPRDTEAGRVTQGHSDLGLTYIPPHRVSGLSILEGEGALQSCLPLRQPFTCHRPLLAYLKGGSSREDLPVPVLERKHMCPGCGEECRGPAFCSAQAEEGAPWALPALGGPLWSSSEPCPAKPEVRDPPCLPSPRGLP